MSGQQALVAVVDDDGSVRQSTCRLIRSFGYRAEGFAGGDEFLAFLSSPRAAEAACLILDVRMPGIGGLEVQRRLVERAARIPIVFLTALASDDEERRARNAGAIEVLRKPVEKETLLRVLESALRASRGLGGVGHDDD